MQRIGPYELRSELARGGMGAVYRAHDPRTRREVALKLLLRGRDATPEQRRRFLREAEALGRLRHPGIVRVHDAGEHQGAPYLVMDLLAGASLQERLDRQGPLPPAEAADIVRRLALALDHAHAAGVIHRDLKPANVLLVDGAPVLLDFGLSRDLDPSRSRLSLTGQPMGTPGYWAPEQARGELAAIGPATDVYGLGATLYALLTAQPPCLGASLVDTLHRTSSVAPTPPARLNAEVSHALERVCLSALAKAPSDRPPTAGGLAAALEDVLAGRRLRRRRWPLLAAGAGALVLCAVLATRRPSEPAIVPEGSPTPTASLGGASPPEVGAPEPALPPPPGMDFRPGERHHYRFVREEVGRLKAVLELVGEVEQVTDHEAAIAAVISRVAVEAPGYFLGACDTAAGEPPPGSLGEVLEELVGAPFTLRIELPSGRPLALDGFPDVTDSDFPERLPEEVRAQARGLLIEMGADCLTRYLQNALHLFPDGPLEPGTASWSHEAPVWIGQDIGIVQARLLRVDGTELRSQPIGEAALRTTPGTRLLQREVRSRIELEQSATLVDGWLLRSTAAAEVELRVAGGGAWRRFDHRFELIRTGP